MALATATFDEILDDLSSRFIINVPEEELASVERICFQIEQAHWFYEDFVREHRGDLPSFTLKNFSAKFFQHSPLLHQWANEHERAFADFMQYKIRVPVCGAIMLNETLDKCLLVKGWSSRSGWGFPKGKINKDELDSTCAAREVFEETGYDITPLLKEDEFIELTMREQRIRLYIIAGVSEDVNFTPQTRKEISQISWHKLNELPTYGVDRRAYSNGNGNGHTLAGYKSDPEGGRFQYRNGGRGGGGGGDGSVSSAKFNGSRFYMVVPFVVKLRTWVHAHRRMKRRSSDVGSLSNGNRHSKPMSEPARKATTYSDVETSMQQNKATVAAATPTGSTQPLHPEPQPTPNESSEILKSMLGIGGGTRIKSPSNEQTSQQPMAPVLQQLFMQQQQQNQSQPQPQLQSQPTPHSLLDSPFTTPIQHFYYPPLHPPLHQPQAYSSTPTPTPTLPDDRARKTSLLNLLQQPPTRTSTFSSPTNDLDIRTRQLKRSTLLDSLYASVVSTSPAPLYSHSARGYAMPPVPNVPGHDYSAPGMVRHRTNSLPFPYMDGTAVSPMPRSKHIPTSNPLWPVPQSPTRSATALRTTSPTPLVMQQQQYQDRLRKQSLLGVLSASTSSPSGLGRGRVTTPPPTSPRKIPSQSGSTVPVIGAPRKGLGGSAGEGELLLQRLLSGTGNGVVTQQKKPVSGVNGAADGAGLEPMPVASASSEALKGLLGIGKTNTTVAAQSKAQEGDNVNGTAAAKDGKDDVNPLTGFKFDVEKIVGCLG